MLSTLQDIQNEFGFIADSDVKRVARQFNVSEAEVHGVVSFYHDFRRTPVSGQVLRLCRAEACQSRGSEGLYEQLRNRPGLTVEPVYCLGNCARSPAALLDGELHGDLTAEKVEMLLRGERPARVTEALPEGTPVPAKLYLSQDAAAQSAGSEAVFSALRTLCPNAEVIRTGTRGLLWLEPLLEIETPAGRVAYGPVAPQDMAEILAGTAQHLCHGLTSEIPYLKKQTRSTFRRCGLTDPLSLDDYRSHGGFEGLAKARTLQPAEIVEQIVESGLRGRGGAGFPAGIKWRTVLQQPEAQKYIVCNADEGDSGTYADRILMEGDPFLLIEGMMIAGLATGANYGYIYLRSEYPHAARTLRSALEIARQTGILNEAFDIELRLGAGAYICGEETALLESLEGRRGQIRPKPPLPAVEGLFGKPTVVNNVLTLAAVPGILAEGAQGYRDLGMGRSRGTLPVQLAGNIRRGGLVEIPFGLTLRELIYDFGGGTASGRPVKAVQVGGPLGAYFPEALLDTPLDYEAFTERKGLLGHGGIVVFDDTADLAKQARFAMEFCSIESCGKCTPCRIGSTRGVEVIDRIIANEQRDLNLELLNDLCELMTDGSLCAMGGLTPVPVQSALRHFPEDFAR